MILLQFYSLISLQISTYNIYYLYLVSKRSKLNFENMTSQLFQSQSNPYEPKNRINPVHFNSSHPTLSKFEFLTKPNVCAEMCTKSHRQYTKFSKCYSKNKMVEGAQKLNIPFLQIRWNLVHISAQTFGLVRCSNVESGRGWPFKWT